MQREEDADFDNVAAEWDCVIVSRSRDVEL
jgi:hypothetical protein